MTGSGTASVYLSTLDAGLSNSNYALQYQWNIAGLSPTITSATFSWTSGAQGINFPAGGSDLYLFRSNGGTWTNVGGPVTTSGTATFASIPCCSGYTVSGLQSLPVELGKFDAKLQNNKTLLDWRTYSESNNSHFSIEKSTDGAYFREIGQMVGHGTSLTTNDYQYTDKSPAKGMNYYRLRQVDFDGQFAYSKVVIVEYESKGSTLVYPTTTTGRLNIKAPAPLDADLEIFVFDGMGHLVHQQQLENTEDQFELDLSRLVSGLYFLKLQQAGSFETFRINKI